MDTSRFPNWTRQEDEQLRLMAANGRSKQDVAQELGRTINAVAARAVATRVRFRSRRHPNDQKPVFRRRCLRCRNLFDVESRFRFVCDLCHALDEWRSADLG
ncbi:MAG: hypothetical protein M0002_02495 [Rhodospirillales bacterium]|nr:hypothetical protein [Rhodospirillales bacterium]